MRIKQTITLKGKSGEKGQSTLELTLLLPLLVVLFVGIVDFSRAIHAKSIITQMSREAANIVARPNTSLTGNEATDFQNAMYFVAKDAGQLKMVSQGEMYISAAEYDTSSSTNGRITDKVAWIQGNGSFASKLPAQNGRVSAAQLNGITLSSANPVVYVVEVFYQYRSIFPGTIFSSPTTTPLYSVTFF